MFSIGDLGCGEGTVHLEKSVTGSDSRLGHFERRVRVSVASAPQGSGRPQRRRPRVLRAAPGSTATAGRQEGAARTVGGFPGGRFCQTCHVSLVLQTRCLFPVTMPARRHPWLLSSPT